MNTISFVNSFLKSYSDQQIRLAKDMGDTIQTGKGDKTIPEIMDSLMWGSYVANRDEGMSHESLVRFGIGNDQMKQRYESQLR